MSGAFVVSSPQPLTGIDILDVTTNGYRWYFPAGEPRELTWSVSSSLWTHPILQSTETQDDFKKVFGNISEFINIQFNFIGYVERANGLTGYENAYLSGSDLNITYAYNGTTSSGARLNDGKFDSNAKTAFCYFPDLDYNVQYLGAAGDTFLNYNNQLLATATFESKTSTFALLLHEVLHGLGLKHPHDSGGTGRPTYRSLEIPYADRQWISVMSYDRHENGGDGAYTGSQPIGPMLLDAIALQYLYGESSFNSGNTSYDLSRYLGNYYNCQWDASGTDLLDAGNLPYGVVIELDGGQLSNGTNFHHVGFITTFLDRLSLPFSNPDKWTWLWGEYENANGSAYVDFISGNDLDNLINGGAGDDYLSGGAGNDRFDFDPSLRGGNDTFVGGPGDDIYVVDSIGDLIQENAYEGVDTVFTGISYSIWNTELENIKTFSGQVFAVSFSGNDWSNILEGGAGNDSLWGYGGSDTLIGSAGNDLINGGAGADTVKFTGAKSDYKITQDASGVLTVLDNTASRDGTDKLSGVEFLSFSDGIIAAPNGSAPTVTTFSPSDEAAGVAIGANVVVTFNEAIQRGTGSITLKTSAGSVVATYDAATSSNLSISGSTLTVNPTADLSSSTGYKVEFAAGTIKDIAGNNYAGVSDYNFTTGAAPDITPPTIAITSNQSSLGVSQTATINFAISESVSDFAVGDITYSGGILSNFAGSGTSYSATFTPTVNSKINGVIGVASNKFSDAAGNFNVDGSDANNTVSMTVNTVPTDTTPPTIAISSSQSSLSVGQTATLSFAISESVSDFVAGDVTVSGGTLSNFSGSGTSYTATFTPTVNSKINGSVSVSNGKFSDAAGNFNVDGSDANNTITMTVNTVVGPNAKPTAASSTLTTPEDTALIFIANSFAFKDSDPSDSLQAISITALPTKGTLKLSGASVSVNQSISVADIVAGKLAFTPVADANGSAYAKVGFKVSDGKDLSTSAYYLTVNITAVNDAPTVAKPITTPLSLIEGKAFSFSLPSGTFKDVDDKVLTYSATGLLAGMVIDPKTGKISGSPGYSAADVESNTVTIKVTDKAGLSTSTPLTIKVTNTPAITGTTKGDNFVAGAGADSMSGGNANDTLSGGAGNDTLVGGAGTDVLTGGDGADWFVFDTSLGTSNIDSIKDFATGTDKTVLSAKVFSKFTGSSTGSAITAGNLVVGAGTTAVAKDNDDYLIYDTTSDLLYYDKDGSGSGAPVAFVKIELTGTVAPAFGDFLVVS
jgi:Ca2+-binding RTX toxin-like protein